jgi:hypothetical protein
MHNTRYIIVFFLIFTASTYSMDKNPNTFPSRGHQQLAINAMQSAKQKCIEKTTNRKNTDAFRAAEQQYMQTVEKVRQTGPAIVNNQAAFSDFKVFDGKLEEAVKTENYKEITPAFADKYKSTLELVNTTHKELGQQLRTFNKPTMVDVETQTDPEPVEIKAAFNNTKKDLTQKHPKETSIQRFQAGLLHLLDFLSEKEQEEVFNRFDKADMETIKTIGSKYFPFSLEEADKVSAPATQPATGILTPKQKNKKSKKHKKLQLATGSVTNAKPELVAGMKSAEVALIQASKELLQISQNCQK